MHLLRDLENAEVADDTGENHGKQHCNDAEYACALLSDMVGNEGEAKMRASLCGDRRAHQADKYEQIVGYLLGKGERTDNEMAGYDICECKKRHNAKANTAYDIFNII